MERIKAWIRKRKWLYRILAGTYRNTIYLVRCGYVKSMLRYLLKVAGPEKKKLKARGFRKPKAYASKTWRIGKGLDGAHRRYYTAVYRGQKVFIKVAMKDATIANEIQLAEYLQDKKLPFVCPAVDFTRTFAPQTMMLANPFISGIQSLSLPETQEDFAAMCRQYLEILEALEDCGVIHADVHKNNLMVAPGGKLVLFDFGISIIRNVENTIDYKARPGTFYTTPQPGVRVYDDAYSFVMEMKRLKMPQAWETTPAYQQIEKRIGCNAATVQLNKENG